MQTVGPIGLALNVISTIKDPAQLGGPQSAAVQLQNSSAFVLEVIAAGTPLTIQPFTASTIPISGQPTIVIPTQNPSGSTIGTTLTAVFLLANERPPMEDGPLTSAAILAAISGLVSTQASVTNLQNAVATAFPTNGGLAGAQITIPSPMQGITIELGSVSVGSPPARVLIGLQVTPAIGAVYYTPVVSIPSTATPPNNAVIPVVLNTGDKIQVFTENVGQAGWTQQVTINGLSVATAAEVFPAYGAPLDVVNMGGLSVVTVVFTPPANGSLLAASPVGTAYRCHFFDCDSIAAGQLVTLLPGTSIPAVHLNPTVQCIALNGLLATPGQVVQAAASGTNTVRATLFYDVVATPSIQ